ncbi:hypothetical protein CBL_07520 [Carabus blaptoides fortunei]
MKSNEQSFKEEVFGQQITRSSVEPITLLQRAQCSVVDGGRRGQASDTDLTVNNEAIACHYRKHYITVPQTLPYPTLSLYVCMCECVSVQLEAKRFARLLLEQAEHPDVM